MSLRPQALDFDSLWHKLRPCVEQEISNCCEDHLLEKYFERWRKYHAGAKYLDRLFHYLNAQYVNKLKITDSDLFYGRLFREENQVNTKFVGEFYIQKFEIPFLKDTSEYYVDIAVLEKIRQEEARSERILHRSGVDKVQQICQEVLVNRHMSMFKSVAKEIVAQQFVEEILAVFDKYGQIVKKTFKGDHEFSAALDRACLAVINHRNGSKDPAKAAEW
ncbi:cullin family protein, partial [Trichinella spiralis]|uniref:cullin family protein n=1 Tax=Trichinella spiralis TaxID=6334 RepID=UPI0001EFCC3E